jgi:hypothetical protein
VRKLEIAPSEFWQMSPRHFRWLLETLEPPEKPGLTDEERDILKSMYAKAKKEAGVA